MWHGAARDLSSLASDSITFVGLRRGRSDIDPNTTEYRLAACGVIGRPAIRMHVADGILATYSQSLKLKSSCLNHSQSLAQSAPPERFTFSTIYAAGGRGLVSL
jgi:hypothetical protein